MYLISKLTKFVGVSVLTKFVNVLVLDESAPSLALPSFLSFIIRQ